jgi:hypothetical protein
MKGGLGGFFFFFYFLVTFFFFFFFLSSAWYYDFLNFFFKDGVRRPNFVTIEVLFFLFYFFKKNLLTSKYNLKVLPKDNSSQHAFELTRHG